MRRAATWKTGFNNAAKEKEWVLRPASKRWECTDENKAAVGIRDGEKEEVRCEILIARKNRVFQKNYMRIGVRMLLRMGFGPSESVERSRCWHRAYRKVEVEEAVAAARKKE